MKTQIVFYSYNLMVIVADGFDFLNLIDNHWTYRYISYIYYAFLNFIIILSFKDGSNPILPNPIILILSYLIIILSYQSAQVIEPILVQNHEIKRRIVLSAIPFLLGSIESYLAGKKQKNKKGDFAIWLNLYLVSAILGILALTYFLLLVLIYIESTQTHALYLFTIGIWLYLPYLLIDKRYLYTENLEFLNAESDKQRKPKFQSLITSMYFTRTRRIVIFSVHIALFGVVIILNSKIDFYPISL